MVSLVDSKSSHLGNATIHDSDFYQFLPYYLLDERKLQIWVHPQVLSNLGFDQRLA